MAMGEKAGFWDRMRGADKPDGSTRDAWDRLRRGDVEGGRELLRRLCKHEPMNLDAHLLSAFELMRPPNQGPEAKRIIQAAYAIEKVGSHFQSLISIASFSALDPKTAFDCYMRAIKEPTRNSHAASFLLLARLCSSDLVFRVGFAPAGAKEVAADSVRLNPLNTGSAAFVLRRYDEALKQFRGGGSDPAQTTAKYCELGKLSPEQREVVVGTVRRLSPVGEALVLRDQGKAAEAKAIWERLEQDLSGDADAPLFGILASE
jgi:hypothetical protein